MTIDKAIEILKRRHGELEAPIDGEMKHALGLGIEALKAVQRHRGNNDYNDYTYIAKLRGETEEVTQ